MAPAAGLLNASATRTVNGSGSARPALSTCRSPDWIAMLVGGPAVAVALKVRLIGVPTTVAV